MVVSVHERNKTSIVGSLARPLYTSLDYDSDVSSAEANLNVSNRLRFMSYWGDTCEVSSLGVGYINGGNVTLLEAQEEGLELSRVLGGVPVAGVYNRGWECLYCLIQKKEVEATLLTWEDFFYNYPEGKFIQYFYGNGGKVVEIALKCTSYASRIVVVGINPSPVPTHENAYYYSCGQLFPRFCGSNADKVVRLPERIGSIGGPIRCVDPTFVAALQYPYQCQWQISYPSLPGDAFVVTTNFAAILGIRPEDGGYYVRTSISKQESPELFYRAYTLMRSTHFALKDGEHWTENRFQIWLNLWISCLRVVDGMWFLIGQRLHSSMDLEDRSGSLSRRTRGVPELIENHKRSWFGKPLADLIFVNGEFLSSSPLSDILPVRKLPLDLFPMGITPSGEFTEGLYGGTCNPRQSSACPSFPFGKFPDETFPYKTFFSGGLTTFSYYKIDPPEDKPNETRIEKIFSDENGSSVFPYGIQPDGKFSFACTADLQVHLHHWNKEDSRDYSDKWTKSSCKRNREVYMTGDFDYEAFFQGNLHPKVIGDHLNGSDDSRYLFPGGILPNGSFPNRLPGDEYPYGHFLTAEFNVSFPYDVFFSGKLVTRSSQRIPMTAQEFLFEFNHDIFDGWRGIAHSGQSRRFQDIQDLFSFVEDIQSFVKTFPWNSETIRTCLFSVYWGAIGASQCVLLHPSNGSVMRVVKRAARAFSATAFYMNVANLIHSAQTLWWPIYPKAEVSVQSSLMIYSSIACFNDFSQYVLPKVRNQIQRVTKVITRMPATEVHAVVQIDLSFRKQIYLTRKIIHLFLGLLCALAFLTRFYVDTELYTTRVTRAHDALHSLGLGISLALLISALFFAYR